MKPSILSRRTQEVFQSPLANRWILVNGFSAYDIVLFCDSVVSSSSSIKLPYQKLLCVFEILHNERNLTQTRRCGVENHD
jgi:hypothetical protein